MEVTFLGTSSAVPSKMRNHTSIALRIPGEVFLFDCGEGTQRQMALAGISPMKVTRIFITHLHGDHILGIPGMIQSMGFRGREEPLELYGPPGTLEVYESMMKVGYFSLDFEIQVNEITEGVVVEEDEYLVSCARGSHSVTNLAYCFQEKKRPRFLREKAIALGLKPGPDFGRLHRGIPVRVGDRVIMPEEVLGEPRRGVKICYSGDTRPCESIVKLARGADLLIHESTFEAGKKDKAAESGHSTAAEAARVARDAEVRRLILTHLSTRYRRSEVLEEAAREIFPETVVAEDLMTLEVNAVESHDDG